MATATISHDQDAIEAEVYIAAPRERVFQALTDPRQTVQWWGQKGMYHHTGWKADLRPGGEWRSDGVSDVDGKPYHVGGEYLEIDPPRTVSFTWIASWSGPAKTLVRWDLEESGEGTKARVRHSGFAALGGEHVKNHYQGWTRVIAWMQAFVERGETVETRPPVAKPPTS